MRPGLAVLFSLPVLFGSVAAQPASLAAIEVAAVLDQAAELADWCVQHGHGDEAAVWARRVLRVAPDHAVASLPRRLVDLAVDPETRAPAWRSKHAPAYPPRAAALRRAVAQCLAAVREADDAAAITARLSLLTPDLPGLDVRLRALGYEWIAGYGAVERADATAWRQVLRDVGGAFAVAGEAGRPGFSDALAVRTRRYRVIGNIAPALLVETAARLEAVYGFWERLAREAALELVEPPDPLVVELYDSRATFDLLVPDRLLRAACARETAVVGVYSFRARVACSYVPSETQDGRRQLVENACHEAVHQLFHLRVRGRAALPADAMGFSWLEEAVCLYCEHGELGAQVRAPACCDDDLRRGAACARTDFDPLARVRRVSQGLFLDAGDYGCAALLADFLLSAPAATRSHFLATLRDDLTGPGTGARALSPWSDDASLREAFEAHAGKVVETCGR